MFLTAPKIVERKGGEEDDGRNPLKSGQCFLRRCKHENDQRLVGQVAIPSNRVNVSYTQLKKMVDAGVFTSRNPLKSGQCFLHVDNMVIRFSGYGVERSQSPQIGSMFLTS